MRCKFKFQGSSVARGAKAVAATVDDDATVDDLQWLAVQMLQEAGMQGEVVLKTGWPGKELPSRGQEPVKAWGVENGALVTVVVGEVAEYVRRDVPADNSCLFRAVALLKYGTRDDEVCRQLRSKVAETIRGNPAEWSPLLPCGKSVHEYTEWIVDEKSWGGWIELVILSKLLEVNFVAIDIKTCKELEARTAAGLEKAFLLYDGIHYDALVKGVVMDHSKDQRTFSNKDDSQALEAFKAIAAKANAKKAFTDLAQFTVRCMTCNKGFIGQEQAVKHSKTTGHTNFSERK